PGPALVALGQQGAGLDTLEGRLRQKPGVFGLGVEEQSAVVLKGRRISRLGDGAVHVLQGAGGGRPATTKVLKGSAIADLVAQQRSAVARTQPPFPPVHPETPCVPN